MGPIGPYLILAAGTWITWEYLVFRGLRLPAATVEEPPRLDAQDEEIVSNILALPGIRVRDSMVPIEALIAVETGTDLETVRQTFIRSGFSKLPVYHGSRDRIVGVVLAYDLFKQPESLAAITRPVRLVSGSRRSHDLLADFRSQGHSMAIVVDRTGKAEGLVTIEDLLEEVVGDIRDEHDDIQP